MTKQQKWDLRFLKLAHHVAGWSKDQSTQVGAVIADKRNRIISLGFNGFPAQVTDHSTDRETKLLRTIHAEDNAILCAQRNLDHATIFVTHPPCARCAAKIIQSGISRVVSWNPPESFKERWAADLAEASDMYRSAAIEFTVYEKES